MRDQDEKTRKKPKRRVEPFSSEAERLEAVENLRRWIDKLRDWDDDGEWRLSIRVSKRDLN